MPYSRNSELPSAVRSKYTPKQQRAFRQAYNDAEKRGLSQAQRFQTAHAAARRAGDSKDAAADWAFSAEERKKLAEKGHALPDGSFPIRNKSDLRNAIQAYGRASNKSKAKAHIIKRARALGATDALPEGWGDSAALEAHAQTKATQGEIMDVAEKEKKKGYRKKDKDKGSLEEFECVHENCGRSFATEDAAADHAAAVHTHSDVRTALSKALRRKFASGPGPRTFTFVVDVADDWFVYAVEERDSMEDRLYRQGYSYDNGEATLDGEPEEVRQQMTYVPVGGGNDS